MGAYFALLYSGLKVVDMSHCFIRIPQKCQNENNTHVFQIVCQPCDIHSLKPHPFVQFAVVSFLFASLTA